MTFANPTAKDSCGLKKMRSTRSRRAKPTISTSRAGRACFAQVQRQAAQILALERQDVELIAQHLGIVPARMQAVAIALLSLAM